MITKIIQGILIGWKFRRTYNELNKLSTRELEDIGLSRYMITRIAMEKARNSTL